MKETIDRFDVVIYEYKTGIIEAVIGNNMNEKAADRRAETGLSRCNPDYGTVVLPTSEERKKGDHI
jgi:hypothetical protein